MLVVLHISFPVKMFSKSDNIASKRNLLSLANRVSRPASRPIRLSEDDALTLEFAQTLNGPGEIGLVVQA